MKAIPIALQADKDQDANIECFLMRLLTKDGTLFASTSLDADVLYDPAAYDPEGTGDAWGSAVHLASEAFTPERMQATADLGVDNTNLLGWMVSGGTISKQQVLAGIFDYAQVRVYRVNPLALDHGHELVLAGTCGETTFSRTGWSTEFRSFTQQLRQPKSDLYSLTCTKIFGSKPFGTGGEQPEEEYPCGVDWTWVEGEVTAVDVTEPRRIFTDSASLEADDHYSPGVVEWLTGDNAGKQMEIDSNTAGVYALSLELPFPIAVTDTYRRRQDCNKRDRLRNGVPGDCKDKHNNLVNHGGQPDIPVSDGGTLMVPGAHIRQ